MFARNAKRVSKWPHHIDSKEVLRKRCDGISKPERASRSRVVTTARRQLGGEARDLGFSPLLDGDGVASAPELPHSTTLLVAFETHFRADDVSADKPARSANSDITTRLHNSLRTRIPRSAF